MPVLDINLERGERDKVRVTRHEAIKQIFVRAWTFQIQNTDYILPEKPIRVLQYI